MWTGPRSLMPHPLAVWCDFAPNLGTSGGRQVWSQIWEPRGGDIRFDPKFGNLGGTSGLIPNLGTSGGDIRFDPKFGNLGGGHQVWSQIWEPRGGDIRFDPKFGNLGGTSGLIPNLGTSGGGIRFDPKFGNLGGGHQVWSQIWEPRGGDIRFDPKCGNLGGGIRFDPKFGNLGGGTSGLIPNLGTSGGGHQVWSQIHVLGRTPIHYIFKLALHYASTLKIYSKLKGKPCKAEVLGSFDKTFLDVT